MKKLKKDNYVRFRIDEITKRKIETIKNANGCSKSNIYREAIELLFKEKYNTFVY